MWRWILRVYVAFVVFAVFLFLEGILLVRFDHLLMHFGWAGLNCQLHEHTLSTMFLLGLVAGQAYLGSNFTGRGWFRSKSGLTYEGFRLEWLKPWTWLIWSPVFLAGILFWLAIQSERGALNQISWTAFWHGYLAPDCSDGGVFVIGGDFQCGFHLMFLGTWIAAVGYSVAPLLRKQLGKIRRSL
jgi:hypothetical protein